MKYVSTRGACARRDFSEILLEGLAQDGGLYMPERYPEVGISVLKKWHQLPYVDLAFELFSLFIDDVPSRDLRDLLGSAYNKEKFGISEIVSLKQLDPDIALVGLSNGPTLAFKDIAMQFLGAIFEYELNRQKTTLNILGATSGDTGSAAEYAMRGKKGINVFMLSPHGRMSSFQQAQMFSLQDKNIHNISVTGVFDDCQDIVKAVSNDLDFKKLYKIGTVNSINWARLLAQTVYYFFAYFKFVPIQKIGMPVNFCVPSGNFGNVCAGHIARMMGLPISKLIVATNENDVLDEFFRTGTYRVRQAAETFETSSPSMDISKASNFERFIFDLLERDGEKIKSIFGEQLNKQGRFVLKEADHLRIADYGFLSGKSTHQDRLTTIKSTWEHCGVMIDPHTADAVKVAQQYRTPDTPMLVLETALPAKFAATLHEATGQWPPCPAHLDGVEQLPRRSTVVPPDVGLIKKYIAEHVQPVSS